jgi:hypothetical protein
VSFRRIIFTTGAPRSVMLIRLIVGAVFLSEGIQNFLFPTDLGVGVHKNRNSLAADYGALCRRSKSFAER